MPVMLSLALLDAENDAAAREGLSEIECLVDYEGRTDGLGMAPQEGEVARDEADKAARLFHLQQSAFYRANERIWNRTGGII